MSKIIGKGANIIFVVEDELEAICELCGKKAELRPYGPNNENICFECGMKDEKKTIEMFKKKVIGVTHVTIENGKTIPRYQNRDSRNV